MPGKDGLLHISQIRKMVGGKRVENVEDVLAVGQKVQVEISEIDPRGKLSLIPVLAEAEAGTAEGATPRSPSTPAPTPDVAVPTPARRRWAPQGPPSRSSPGRRAAPSCAVPSSPAASGC